MVRTGSKTGENATYHIRSLGRPTLSSLSSLRPHLEEGDVEGLHVRASLALDQPLDHRELVPHAAPGHRRRAGPPAVLARRRWPNDPPCRRRNRGTTARTTCQRKQATSSSRQQQQQQLLSPFKVVRDIPSIVLHQVDGGRGDICSICCSTESFDDVTSGHTSRRKRSTFPAPHKRRHQHMDAVDGCPRYKQTKISGTLHSHPSSPYIHVLRKLDCLSVLDTCSLGTAIVQQFASTPALDNECTPTRTRLSHTKHKTALAHRSST